MKNLRTYQNYDICTERLSDIESEEVGVYACSQGLFNAPNQNPNIVGGYIINEEDNKKEIEEGEDDDR